jgi:hypothetical protein
MAICELCETNSGVVGAIINGVYHRSVCSSCNGKSAVVSSGHARWMRSVDAEDHEADIQQPYNSDGTINTRFAKLYPEQARALFSEDELRKAER